MATAFWPRHWPVQGLFALLVLLALLSPLVYFPYLPEVAGPPLVSKEKPGVAVERTEYILQGRDNATRELGSAGERPGGSVADAPRTKAGRSRGAANWYEPPKEHPLHEEPPGQTVLAGLLDGQPQSALPGAEVPPQILSQREPRAYLFEDFLSATECEYLIELASRRLQSAGILEGGQFVQMEDVRNSQQLWFTQDEEMSVPMLRHLIKRMHRVAHIPEARGEPLQIGRYTVGQKYELHLDSSAAQDLWRPATLIVYLSDVEAGGDTFFPRAQQEECKFGWHKNEDGQDIFGCAGCCNRSMPGSIRVRPKRGRALLFFNHDVSGTNDEMSRHASCPVVMGTKWIAQRWFRFKHHPKYNVQYEPDPRFDGVPVSSGSLAPDGPWGGRIRPVMQVPGIFLLEGFLSAAERAHFVELAAQLEAAGSTDGASPQLFNISSTMERESADVVRVAKRLYRAAYVPESQAWPLQLVRADAAADCPGPPREGPVDPAFSQHATALISLGRSDAAAVVFPRRESCLSAQRCCHTGEDGARIPALAGRGILVYGARPFCVCGGRRDNAWLVRRRFHTQFGTSTVLDLDHRHDIAPDREGNVVVM